MHVGDPKAAEDTAGSSSCRAYFHLPLQSAGHLLGSGCCMSESTRAACVMAEQCRTLLAMMLRAELLPS